MPAIHHFAGKLPIMGVCLGHQSIGQAFGGKIIHAKQLMHGKVSPVSHHNVGMFRDLPNPVTCTRYHSLVIERETMPDCLEITAWTEDGEIMGVRHKTLPIEGVQFHPESIPDRTRSQDAAKLPDRICLSRLPTFCRRHCMITPQAALNRLIDQNELFHDEMLDLMRQIMRGEVPPPLIAAILIGLRVKTESVLEIAAAAQVMREFATAGTGAATRTHLVDTCGTGGDKSHTFNISTTAAFVSAAAGARVAKHGGRSVSSSSGSADVLEALGVNLALDAAGVARCIDQIGVGFMFAPNHHTAMKYVAPVRKELGVTDHFQYPGAADQPCRRPQPGDGRFPPRSCRHPGTCVAPAG